MATLSSVLAWRISWTEEPGGLQSAGSQSRTRLSSCGCTQATTDAPAPEEERLVHSSSESRLVMH